MHAMQSLRSFGDVKKYTSCLSPFSSSSLFPPAHLLSTAPSTPAPPSQAPQVAFDASWQMLAAGGALLAFWFSPGRLSDALICSSTHTASGVCFNEAPPRCPVACMFYQVVLQGRTDLLFVLPHSPPVSLHRRVHPGFTQQDKEQECGVPRLVSLPSSSM